MHFRAWCNEADCMWEEGGFETDKAALKALALHCLEKHPEVAVKYPVVQAYAQDVAAESAPTNGHL